MPRQPPAKPAGDGRRPGKRPQDPGQDGGSFVQSVERASAILDAVARARPGIGLAELAKTIGLHASSTLHLAKALVALGYLRQAETTRLYRLGPKIFALAAAGSGEQELVKAATPVLVALAAATGESAMLAIDVVAGEVTVLARTEGIGASQSVNRTGAARPAYCTALGKVMLAAAPPNAFERFLAETVLAPRTSRTITDAERLWQEIEQVRRKGVAYDDGEFDPELRCIAVPVRDFSGQVVAALGLAAQAGRMSVPRMEHAAAELAGAAARLSAELGWRAALAGPAAPVRGGNSAAPARSEAP
jgi:DNA-binding IclR family transcriptional regulator